LWSLAGGAAALAAGAALLTVALGAASVRAGGPFWFYAPSVRALRDLTAGSNRWSLSPGAWLPHASWLVWPGLAVLGCPLGYLARLLVSRGASGTPWWWPVNGLVMVGLFLGLQLKGTPVLQFYCYAVYLTPWALLAVSALLRGPLERLRPAQFVGLVALSVGAALAQHLGWIPGSLRLPLAVGAVGLGLASLFGGRRGLAFAGLALVGLTNGLLPCRGFPAVGERERGNFARVCRGVDAVNTVVRGARPKFWYAADEPCGTDGGTLAALWLCSTVNDRFPALDPGWSCTLRPGDYLVVVSGREGAFELALEAMAGRGVELRPAGRSEVDCCGGNYSLTFAEVVAVPQTGAAGD
jgi:hypothetical protein